MAECEDLGRPDAEVEDPERIIAVLERRGVAGVVPEPPDEARASFGERVHLVECLDERCRLRCVDRTAEWGDVELGEMVLEAIRAGSIER